MESLFASGTARKRRLPPAIRRLVVDLEGGELRFLSPAAN